MGLFELRPPKWAYIVFAIGICTLAIRAILDSRFANSALLYVAIPFVISILLFHFSPKPEGSTSLRRYLGHIRDATIIMLGTSAFLFEGFICVLFFMPIYYLFVSIGFLFGAFAQHEQNRLRASILPLLVGLMAIEGTAASTSFERNNEVTRTYVINADVETLQANMAKPIELPRKRQWFLSIFPLPTDVQAGSLKAGDIHRLKFIYKRWFFTNIQEGELHLSIDSVSPQLVETSVVRNTSHLSKYLKIHGTRIEFDELSEQQTKVTLRISYDRLLDPVWYFDPLQRYTVGKSGDYFVAAVFARGATYE